MGYDSFDYQAVKEWFEGFEKELRERFIESTSRECVRAIDLHTLQNYLSAVIDLRQIIKEILGE